jgi:hypothetical protein
MITANAGREEVISEIETQMQDLKAMVQNLSADQINTIPYKNSWTAAQLLVHVSKSTKAVAGAMEALAEIAGRDPGEKINGLRAALLDFSTSLKAPGFIVLEEGVYKKEDILGNLAQSINALKKAVVSADLKGLVKDFPLGDVTKLELLHFALYHTQRHLHQMQKISAALSFESQKQ